MPVKDKVVTWWIQNVILPKREIIDKPGFIITTFTEQKQTTYLRDIFLSEQLFELIEKRIVEQYESGNIIKEGIKWLLLASPMSVNQVS